MISVKGLDGSPAGPRPAIGDHPTAMSLFGAIMLGLYHRERTGRGSKVGTSLLASGAWAHACDLQAKICGAEFPERAAGKGPVNPLTSGYISRDGKIVMLVLLDPENEFPRLCRGIGHPDLATNSMFATQDARTEHSAELFAILQSQIESRDLAELKKIFAEFDIKWSTIPTMDEVVADPQMRAAEAFVEFDYPGRGTMETINSPIFMAGAEKRRPAAAPEVGAHTREVLAELGYSGSEIAELIRRGAALQAG